MQEIWEDCEIHIGEECYQTRHSETGQLMFRDCEMLTVTFECWKCPETHSQEVLRDDLKSLLEMLGDVEIVSICDSEGQRGYRAPFTGAYVCYRCGHLCECGDD